MKIKTLLEKLTDKWPAKAICIVAACFFYIFNQYTSLEQKSVPVTLNVLQEGEMLCTTHIPSSVSVTIRTNSENIASISSNGIVANLDLNYFTSEGTFDVPVYIDLPTNIKGLEPLQVSVYPEKIKVHLERNLVRSVRVEPQSVGQLPYGYTLKDCVSDPAYVEIFGPRSIVESINSVHTQAIILDDQKASFTQQLMLVNLDKLVKFNGVNEVNVSAEIDLTQGSRKFKRFPVLIRGLPSGFEVEETYFADFSVSGSQLSLDDYEPLPDALYVDLSLVTQAGEYELPLEVLIPQEFHLESISDEVVNVVVTDRPPAVLE